MKGSEDCSVRDVSSIKTKKSKVSSLLKPSLIAFAVAQTMSMSSAQAATIEVNNNTDDGVKCTLRKAVLSINDGLLRPRCTNTGDPFGVNDTINFDETLFNDTISLTKGPLRITQGTSVLIDASSVQRVTVDASNSVNTSNNNNGGIFSVTDRSELSIENLSITGGSASLGGAIYASKSAVLNIENSAIHENQAGQGGGIWLGINSFAEVTNSSISNNNSLDAILSGSSVDGGGGIFVRHGSSLVINNSSIADNTATNGSGGGIYLREVSTAVINQSTVSGNYALAGGGLNVNFGSSMTLVNSTLSSNEVNLNGGGIRLDNASSLDLASSTIADNYSYSFPSPSIYARPNQNNLVSANNSIVAGNCQDSLDAGTFFGVDNTNIASIRCGGNPSDIDPELLPLADNGCTTTHATPTGQACVMTHALQTGSPAIDAAFSIVATDQLGTARPQGTGPDIGAYEKPTFSVSGFSVTASDSREAEDEKVIFTITLDEAQTEEVAYEFRTEAGTAIDGEDFVGRVGQIIFPAGVTELKRRVTIIDDGESFAEDDEFFSLVVTNKADPSASITAEAIIRESNITPVISVEDVSVLESAGKAKVVFKASRTSPYTRIKFNTVTRNIRNPAIEGEDYIERSGYVAFYPGKNLTARTIDLINDDVFEGEEVFELVLSDPSNAEIETGSERTEIVILDDDIVSSDVPIISFEQTSPSANERDDNNGAYINFIINLSHPQTEKVSVDYQTVDVTAVGDVDYVARSGRMTFAPGQTRKVRNVYVLGDTEAEINETFNLVLSNPSSNAVINSGQASLAATIFDDDTSRLPKITIRALNLSVSEGLTTDRNIDYEVKLSEPQTEKVSVDYQTMDLTAVAGEDYVARSGTMTFMPGQTSKRRTIEVLDDLQIEGDETFELVLSNPSDGVRLDFDSQFHNSIGTILDDD